MRVAEAITLSPDERAVLDKWAAGGSFPYRLVQRARIIRMAADGALSQDIARTLRISRPTVQLWRQRFLALRIAGLEKDAPRPGRIPRISQRKVSAVIQATLHTTPPHATHWSARRLAQAQGLSKDTIHRIWKQHNLKPHLIETFKLSRDKRFIEKLHDVVGLYWNPPDKALVLCVDEKSQIQALDRTQPLWSRPDFGGKSFLRYPCLKKFFHNYPITNDLTSAKVHPSPLQAACCRESCFNSRQPSILRIRI